MAEKYPKKSSFGRTLKPSSRMKDVLSTSAVRVYEDVYSQLVSSSSQLCNHISSQAPLYIFRDEYNDWQQLYEEFTDTNDELLRYISNESKPSHLASHQQKLEVLRDLRRKSELYIEKYDNVTPPPKRSDKPSKIMMQLDRRTKEIEKQIAKISMSTEQEQEKGENYSSRRPFMVPNYIPSSIMPSQMRASTPKRESIDDGWPSSASSVSSTPSKKFTDPLPKDDATQWNLRRRSKTREETLDPTLDVLNRLAEVLKENKKQLPPREPDMFAGDLTEYPSWINSFEELVEPKLDYPRDGLNYLARYTTDLAKKTIRGFLNMGTDRAYFDAKQRLATRFGSPYKVAEAYRKKLNDWKPIKKGDVEALQDYSDFLWQCYSAMDSIEYLSSLNHSEENIRMIRKLPTYLVERWNRQVVKWCNQGDYLWNGRFLQGYPPFAQYCVFVAAEVQVVEGPCSFSFKEEAKVERLDKPGGIKTQARKPLGNAVHAMNTTAGTTSADSSTSGGKNRTPYCAYCKREGHYISGCDVFLALDPETKTAFAKSRGLCFGCLRRTHRYKECRSKNPELLKGTAKGKASVAATTAEETDEGGTLDSELIESENEKEEARVSTGVSSTTTLVVPVVVLNPSNGREVIMYCMVDSQCDSCFIREDVAVGLGLIQTPVDLTLTTMSSSSEIKSTLVQDLIVQGLNESYALNLPRCFTKNNIPCNKQSIPKREDVESWEFLKPIAHEIQPYHEEWPVGLMIGHNHPIVFRYHDCLSRNDDEPFACKTVLGWSVIGPTRCTEHETVNHQINCHTINVSPSITELKDVFDSDFVSQSGQPKMSRDDQKFLKIMAEGIVQLPSGHYQVPLPFKEGKMPVMPNNRGSILAQAESLRNKLLRDEKYAADYIKSMKMNIDRGFVERVPEEELIRTDGAVNYVGHHGVRHPQKPKEIRPVYNASQLCRGISLNQMLLSGPDLTNNLTGIILRFREEQIVVVCDIEKMFYQVYVAPEHRDYLRFFWHLDNDPAKPLVEFRFLVHMFGAKSSPGCVNYALKTTADQYEEKYGSLAADFVRRFFYVDDGIKGVPDVKTGVLLVESSHALCLEGGFNLCKYLSNSREVMAQIPREFLAKEVQSVDFSNEKEQLPVGRSLGCIWAIENDVMQFRIQIRTRDIVSRRTMLSTIGSIYDPLGLAGPVLLTGRRLLQKMCQQEIGWDERVPPDVEKEWLQWVEGLDILKDCKIDRCYRTNLRGSIVRTELHHFSDASMDGHGCSSYLRLVDEEGNVAVNLVMAKAKVNPMRAVTVPRLELQAAVLAVVLSEFLQRELSYTNITNYYWSDSTVTLGYIGNNSKRFHIYVSNRVQRIHDTTSPSQWYYVPTAENPADLASRGCSSETLRDSPLWWKGPGFLLTFKEEEIEDVGDYLVLDTEDPEIRVIKKSVVLNTTTSCSMIDYYSSISSWDKLVKAIALWKKFCRRLKARIENKPIPPTWLIVADLIQVHNQILRQIQVDSYPEEYRELKKKPFDRNDVTSRYHTLKRSSKLYKLDPFIDGRGLLRVGGRIKRSELIDNIKNPVLLPHDGHVTRLIIDKFHQQVHHSGIGITLNNIRTQGYWIVKSRSAVRSFISKCVICQKLRGRPAVQIMADLPEDRLKTDTPPFSYCGVDLFGPILVKQGRVEKKRWICLFTDLVMRAVHLEPVASLTTDSFLNAYRRFVNRRGPIRLLRCDQGTNFVGAQNDLRKALAELDDEKIHQELLQDNCDWIKFQYNSPQASYQGGAWERLIGVTKRILNGLLLTHGNRLDDELLHTFIVEVENIVNTRPLTYQDTTSPLEGCALSPSHLLTMKTKIILPLPGKFVRQDVYCRKRWRAIQYLSDQFWQKWIKAYVPSVQERQKWAIATDNLKKDDLVLVVDDNLPRNRWQLGRILQTIVDQDKAVRRVRVKTTTSTFERPIQKIVLLLRPKPSVKDG